MKNPWLNVLDHRFLDLHLTNCRHTSGSFAVSSPQPQVLREPGSDNVLAYYASFDGETSWLRFTPETPLRNIIGIELRIRMRLRQPFLERHLNTLCWSGNWGLGVYDRQFAVTMAGIRKLWTGFPNAAGQWSNIGWSWRVNGQSVLSFNGGVVASWPDMQVGSPNEFSVFGLGSGARIIQGIPPSPPGFSSLLFFPADIALVQLNFLTHERSEKSLDAAFPAVEIENGEMARCWEQIVPKFRDLIALFRTLVSTAVAGNSSGAKLLHGYAVQAAALLARYLDGEDDALPGVENALEKFLRQLKKLTPGQLPEVANQIRQILAGMDASARCREAASELFTHKTKDQRRLQLLLDTISRVIRTTLEVDWND